MDIFLDNSYLTRTGMELTIYIYAKKYVMMTNSDYVPVGAITYQLDECITRKSARAILDTFNEFTKYNSDYIFSAKPTQNFTKIDFQYVENIMSIKSSYKFELIKLLLLIKHTMYDRLSTAQPLSYYAKELGKSEKTISNYIKKLEDLQIVRVMRFFKNSNVIAMYDDSEKVAAYGRGALMENNKKQSLMQKYNWLMRGKTYSEEEMKEIYEYILLYNKAHKNSQKPLDIFNALNYNK